MGIRKCFKLIVALAVMFLSVVGISHTVDAKSYNKNVGSGNVTCDSDNTTYYITGSTNKNNITVDGKDITIYLKNVNINLRDDGFKEKAAINIKGDSTVTIYLEGDNCLKGGKDKGFEIHYGYAAIRVAEGSSVTILGNGKLTAVGGGEDLGAAAIGGDANEDAGKIIIGGNGYNPVINASASTGGAGIGAGYNADAVEGITINSGTITATGGFGAAGIGGGRESYVKDILIKGGTITATGGKYGAGIGGGNAINGGDGGDVNGLVIKGGTITATGGEGAAGIGGGEESEVEGLKIEELFYNTLNITATGGELGAGIGSGNADISSINIALFYGTIKAQGGKNGPGIGAGNGNFGNINITGAGKITATGLKSGCGIGSSDGEDGGNITITGVKGHQDLVIDANAWWDTSSTHNLSCSAAAIGSANAGCGNIKISNANVDICSYGYASGIGSGKKRGTYTGNDMEITISNCTIKDNGRDRYGAGIGAGWDSQVKKITISDSIYSGGNIGGSNCTNNLWNMNDIESIEIYRSIIYAECTDSGGGKAAIGTGAVGEIGLIKIVDSDVTATSEIGAGIGTGGYADVGIFKMTGGGCEHIYIENCQVDAEGGKGGAGIGGGWGTVVDKIEIINCKSVKATGSHQGQENSNDDDEYAEFMGSAGIGGGAREGCGDIIIRGSNVEAKGDYWSAGIGSSGSNTASSTLWNVTCGSISITDSTIKATGGYGGAGIGTGKGTQYVSDAQILIEDSKVVAFGGGKGAGIGAGSNGIGAMTMLGPADNSDLARGGEANIDIKIKGESRVEATGGYGAAGIGGGYEGGAKAVYIELEETRRVGSEWMYYVKAYGGDGAAGIGSGGVYIGKKNIVEQVGQDLGKRSISGGYVYAKGGEDYGLGSGAGIGGGARGGALLGFYVTGGYVEASAGHSYYKMSAKSDIGSGGNDVKDKDDRNYEISGGTIIGSLSAEPSKIVISGGSVKARVNNAVDADGNKVYQTTLELENNEYTPITNLQLTKTNYGKHDIISDGEKRIYFYLPVSEPNAAKADFFVGRKYQKYYGQTVSDGTGWLKKDPRLSIEGIQRPYMDEVFSRVVSPRGNGTVTYTISGVASILDENGNKVNSITADMNNSEVELYGEGRGEFTLTASVQYNNNVYWNGTVSKTETIKLESANIEIVEESGKVYDGTPIDNPGVNTNSDGKLTYHYSKFISEYDTWTEPVEGIPTEVGKYKVWVSIGATDMYTSASSGDKIFYISKRPVTLSMTAKENGGGASVIVKVSGIVDATVNYGKIQLDYIDYQGIPQVVTVPVVKNNDGTYNATADFDSVVSGEHTITATYVEYDSNYTCNPVTQSFDKSKSYREIIFGNVGEKYYGDSSFTLPVSVEAGTASVDDVWTYEIVDYYAELPEAVSIAADGTVTIENAGIAVIKVKVTDAHGVYADAIGYTTITVKPKEVTVTSYAYESGDPLKTPVTSAEYGKLAELEYGMNFTSINATDIDNYGRSIVTLATVPLTESSEAGAHKIEINKVVKENLTRTVDPFMSRNYKVTYIPGEITVTKATLTVNAGDVTMKYGDIPEYTFTYDGLMEWDNIDNVFTESDRPQAIVDTTVTDGKTLEQLKPGVYADVLKPTGVSETDNYKIVYGTAGDLSINKRYIEVHLIVADKVYDGQVAEVKPNLEMILDNTDYDGRLVYTYYEITEEGISKIDGAPTDAGHYAVEVNARESEYYTSSLCRKLYRIEKATPDVDTPIVPDILFEEGLKLSKQNLPEGWSWLIPDMELVVGEVSELAMYTPEDTRNYNTVTGRISFNVYEESLPEEVPDDSEGEEDPEDTVDDEDTFDKSDEGDPREDDENLDGDKSPDAGDSTNIYPFIILALLSAVGIVYLLKRKVEHE